MTSTFQGTGGVEKGVWQLSRDPLFLSHIGVDAHCILQILPLRRIHHACYVSTNREQSSLIVGLDVYFLLQWGVLWPPAELAAAATVGRHPILFLWVRAVPTSRLGRACAMLGNADTHMADKTWQTRHGS